MSTFVRILLAVLVVGIVLQCQDRPGPTEVDSPTGLQTAATQAECEQMIRDLLSGKDEKNALRQFREIVEELENPGGGDGDSDDDSSDDSDEDSDSPLELVIDLIDFLDKKYDDGKVSGDAQDLADLANCLLDIVGVPGDPFPPEAFESDGGFGFCGPDGCEVVNDSEHAGVDIPEGALNEEIMIIITRLPDFPSETFGLAPAATQFYPLDSGFDQYPQFYDISTIPDDVVLNEGFFADVGLCVLEQSDGWEQGAPDEVLDDLVLAHPAPGGPETGNCDSNIECLDFANVGGLIDCGDLEDGPPVVGFRGFFDDYARVVTRPFSPSVLYASPGELGGQASSFSPFAAVDPTSGDLISTTTTLDAEPDTVTQGESITLTASVSPNPGAGAQVDFYEGESLIGTAFTNVDGNAVLIVNTSGGCEFNCLGGTGSHTLTAEFLETPTHGASTSNPVTVLILPPIG